MKPALSLLLALTLCCSVSAEPRPSWWTRHHKEVWLAAGITISAIYQMKAVDHCDKHAGIGKCFEGYGPHVGRRLLVGGLGAVAFGASEFGKHEDLPEWMLPGLAFTGFAITSGTIDYAHRCSTVVVAGQCQDDAVKASGAAYRVR